MADCSKRNDNKAVTHGRLWKTPHGVQTEQAHRNSVSVSTYVTDDPGAACQPVCGSYAARPA